MRIIQAAVIAALLTAGPALASERVTQAVLLTAQNINGLTAVEAPTLDLATFGTFEALFLQASSAVGTADVKVEYALSADGTGFTDYALYTDLVASSAAFAVDNEGWHDVLLPGFTAQFVKFKVTGVGTNPTDTLVTIYFVGRGNIR